MFSRSRTAFTLAELLVSIGVAVTLLSLLLRAVQHARGLTRRTECSSSMRQVHLHLRMGYGWKIENYCPDDPDMDGFFRKRGSSGNLPSTSIQLFEHGGASLYPSQFISPALDPESDSGFWFSSPVKSRVALVRRYIAFDRHIGETANYVFEDGHSQVVTGQQIRFLIEAGYNFTSGGHGTQEKLNPG